MMLPFGKISRGEIGLVRCPEDDRGRPAARLAAAPRQASCPSIRDHFASLGPRAALAIIVVFCSLVLLGLWTGATPTGLKEGPPGNDAKLFLGIIDQLRHGDAYYPTIVREQRAENYPLRPFVTVRLPTLALAMATLPTPELRRVLAGVLAIATFSAWAWRLRGWASRPFSFSAAIVVLGGALLPAVLRDDYTLHELWGGELIALSLAIYHPKTWPVSVAIACLALSIRELSAPFFIVMGALAWRDGRKSEAAVWALGLAAFAGGLAVHAAALEPYVRADDIASEGWLGLGGWRFLLLLMKWNVLLMVSPDWLPAIAAPLALLGLLSQRGAWEDRLTLTVMAYATAFLIFGRTDNSYWGLMIAPLWPIGLFASGPALASLVAKICLPLRQASS